MPADATSAGLPTHLKALLQEDNPFHQVLLEMMDGILICDDQGRIVFFNHSIQEQFQLSKTDLHRPVVEVIHSESFQLSLQEVLTSGEVVSEELVVMCGSIEKTFQFHGVPLMLAQRREQNLSGCVAVFHDITAIKRTEKMRRDFVANVSHELRTPLSAIKGYAETLLEGALQEPEVSRDFVDVIHKHAIRLSSLVEDLLDLSKLEATDFQPELKPISLKPIIARAMGLVETSVSSKNLLLFTHLPEDLPRVWANVSNLEQVFTNLLDNAVKYTPVNGKVAVSAFEVAEGPHQGFVQINVVDTGIGIEAKHVPRLFERFYRVDKARSRDLGGTGLGLSIVKHIIQYHGGEIWVESTPNKGSTFSFTLRKAEES